MNPISSARRHPPVFVATLLLLGSMLAVLRAAQPAFPVLEAGLVAPNLLGITFQDGTFVRAGQEPYHSLPGDEIRIPTGNYKPANTPQLWRDGAFAGWLVQDRTILSKPDTIVAKLGDLAWLDRPESFVIQSADDPRFKKGAPPARLSRKSVPGATTRGIGGIADSVDSVVRHTVYLHLDEPWQSGARYRITLGGGLAPLDLTISDLLPSEAIHTTQLGFAPLDRSKVAFLSIWLGTGGAVSQKDKTHSTLSTPTAQSSSVAKA